MSEIFFHQRVNNLNVERISPLITPRVLKEEIIPVSNKILDFVISTRNQIKDILNGNDKRKLIIIGPCSIHDVKAAKEYGLKLKQISNIVKDKILIVMRVYFEKPRTTVGWKGLINDPDLNNTFNINKGLQMARELLVFLNDNEIPCGYEILDTFTPQYIGDLISWGAIGARTTESQVHRQLVSGLSMPVGFKNNSSGDYKIAADAIVSARHPHCFYGIDESGKAAIVQTKGNQDCHVILRGSKYGTNYNIKDVNIVKEILTHSKVGVNVMVDCSHGNSGKDYRKQPDVFEYLVQELEKDSSFIMGMMIESNLMEGCQKLDFNDSSKLEYGKSITDSCISIQTSKEILLSMYEKLSN